MIWIIIKSILHNLYLYTLKFIQSNLICRYFTYRNFRVMERNRIYDCGWIYCTNHVTRFKADMIVFWRENNPIGIFTILFYMYNPQYKFKGLFWSVDKVND